ncbi:MAG: hypothetical protein N0C88_21755 [Candidatus Thiodiazotropha lotti]|uniref:Uncharacterized protein n=1 Tax=Candidatus Thiodiazotropha lotti TaxID=2792787 RepID=A0A9E4K945_9GAMM|nr:hypothetical protein [Candidatus Thiodiazotropha lotti]MCW4205931.1 hypothetical protein [Candidatus Thiodiazotropha lotti]
MKSAVSLISLVVVFFVGLKLGFYLAPSEFIYRDAQYKSAILAFEIKSLKSGNIDMIIESKEINLDAELANHGRYLISNLSWLLPRRSNEDDRAILSAVYYRVENPYTSPDASKPGFWKSGVDLDSAFVEQTIQGQKELEELKGMVLDNYTR